jgi:uncharacterized repeat protein (TIGR04138 family)
MLFEPSNPIARLIREDRRYRGEAYVFVFESLRFAQEKMGLGEEVTSEVLDEESEVESWEENEADEEDEDLEQASLPGRPAPRHLTGQELCEAMRVFALDQFGMMAKCVLNSWGIKSTSDIGELVYNLIRIGEMRKTPSDRREDFDDVFDFDQGLVKSFKITAPRKS